MFKKKYQFLKRSSSFTKQSLRLEFSNCIDEQKVSDLSNTLSNYTELQTLVLDLTQNEIGHLGAQCLAQMLTKFTKLQNLKLELSHNNIGIEAGLMITSGLSNFTSLKNLSLNISLNEISTYQSKKFKRIITQMKKLVKKVISCYGIVNDQQ
ncbi:hypothetical protein ABPG74_019266 [Tetrahymena malaccensis]